MQKDTKDYTFGNSPKKIGKPFIDMLKKQNKANEKIAQDVIYKELEP